MHHDTRVMHVPWCMPGLLTGGFLWIRWWGKRTRYSRRMHNSQFYAFGNMPMNSKKLTLGYACILQQHAHMYKSTDTKACFVQDIPLWMPFSYLACGKSSIMKMKACGHLLLYAKRFYYAYCHNSFVVYIHSRFPKWSMIASIWLICLPN